MGQVLRGSATRHARLHISNTAIESFGHGIDHWLTKMHRPWTNGQVKWMLLDVCKQTPANQRNQTIKEANVRRFCYETHDQLRKHLADVLDA